MNTAKIIAKNFRFTHTITKRTLVGITQEESLVAPPNGGNCINWIMGHIIISRDDLLESLGEEIVWADTTATDIYERGSGPLTESGTATDITTMQELFDISQEKLLAALERLAQNPSEQEDGKSPEEQAAFYNFHESYHCGQIAILRRILGKDSVIK